MSRASCISGRPGQTACGSNRGWTAGSASQNWPWLGVVDGSVNISGSAGFRPGVSPVWRNPLMLAPLLVWPIVRPDGVIFVVERTVEPPPSHVCPRKLVWCPLPGHRTQGACKNPSAGCRAEKKKVLTPYPRFIEVTCIWGSVVERLSYIVTT